MRTKLKWVFFSLLAMGWVGSALWMTQGCVGKIPTFASVIATSTVVLPSDYIANFENGDNHMNPYLLGSSTGVWEDLAYPSYNKINPVKGSTVAGPFIVPNPGHGNNSQFAAHVFGVLTDPGDSTTYPDFDIKGYFNVNCTTCYYDASSFTGIQFDYYYPTVPVDGQGNSLGHAPPPDFFFDLATARTSPQGQGGLCDANPSSGIACYDHYHINIPHNASWGTISSPFTSLTLEYSTVPWQITDAQRLLYLEFRETANNAAGTYGVDFWIDNIKFLP